MVSFTGEVAVKLGDWGDDAGSAWPQAVSSTNTPIKIKCRENRYVEVIGHIT